MSNCVVAIPSNQVGNFHRPHPGRRVLDRGDDESQSLQIRSVISIRAHTGNWQGTVELSQSLQIRSVISILPPLSVHMCGVLRRNPFKSGR